MKVESNLENSVEDNKNTMMNSIYDNDGTTKIHIESTKGDSSKILELKYEKMESGVNKSIDEKKDNFENNINKLHQMNSMSDKSSTTRKICRICYETTNTVKNRLIAPCLCIGSVKYIHESCLRSWIITSNTPQENLNQTNQMILDKTSCELCKFQYILNEVKKPQCSRTKTCNFLEKVLSLLLVTSITLSVMGYILYIIIYR